MKNKNCGECKEFVEETQSCIYHEFDTTADTEACDYFERPTVFDHITESVEALAEKLVYHIYLTDCLQRKRSYWRSTFFPCNNFATKEKAIVATVAELKKEF
jgi:hypothetical protein